MFEKSGGKPYPVLAGLLCCLLAVTATEAAELFRFTDVRGDDDGAGTLLYPNRPDLQRGDLDLVSFSARSVADGVWFVVEMAQPVRSPAGAVTQFGQLPIDQLARHGFYTFNVDVYIDRDRVPGSGNTQSLPGRKVDIAREFAWERSVILTPRPEVARTLFETHLNSLYEADMRAAQGRVGKAEIDRIQARSRAEIASRYFLPDRIRVAGRSVEFFVPLAFLGGPVQADWAYSVIVTGADLEQSARTGFTADTGPTMMVLPLARGIGHERFGVRSDDDLEIAPVVDLLAADASAQSRALLDYDSVAGRLARVPGVSLAHTSASGPQIAPQAPVAPPPPVSAKAAQTLEPTTDTAGNDDIARRLRSLKKLLDEGLITREEYEQLRRKILNEL